LTLSRVDSSVYETRFVIGRFTKLCFYRSMKRISGANHLV
jgi:hypothetical protein